MSKLRSLSTSSGFKYFMEIAEAQVHIRRQFELTPLKSLDETLEQEFKKGEVSGILFMKHFVDIRLEEIEREIKSITEEIKDEHTETQTGEG